LDVGIGVDDEDDEDDEDDDKEERCGDCKGNEVSNNKQSSSVVIVVDLVVVEVEVELEVVGVVIGVGVVVVLILLLNGSLSSISIPPNSASLFPFISCSKTLRLFRRTLLLRFFVVLLLL